MMSRLPAFLRRFRSDRSGVAAIEFAIIAPVLATSMLVTLDIGNMILDRTDMHSAVRTGAQYLMDGGQDLDRAREIVLASWATKPDDGTVVSERFCMCGELVHSCTVLCGDDSIPDSYVRLEAIATLEGLITDRSQGTEEVVRIR